MYEDSTMSSNGSTRAFTIEVTAASSVPIFAIEVSSVLTSAAKSEATASTLV